MISVIITSFKEPRSIGKCIRCIGNKRYSGIPTPFEIIQVSPDEITLKAGKKAARELKLSKQEYRHVIDPHKGKPVALKMALEKAKGEIVILTDGDTFFEQNAVKNLLEPFSNKTVGGVSGRPVSIDSKENIWGYWGHLLSDAADDRRRKTMKLSVNNCYISEKTFFPMSGYIMAIRNVKIDIPKNVLSDDAYISYALRNKGYEIAYAPDAKCFVKYPTNLEDYLKQKVRSLGGFSQLKRFNIFKKDKQSRSFGIEVRYSLYVLRYAKSFKELVWSTFLFPIRLVTWIRILWERIILKKDMSTTGWERIESTK
jgi:cellulose synthase/poly-beta-1,6-N-acetylglucosamine synthase-like glycosyltransferase